MLELDSVFEVECLISATKPFFLMMDRFNLMYFIVHLIAGVVIGVFCHFRLMLKQSYLPGAGPPP